MQRTAPSSFAANSSFLAAGSKPPVLTRPTTSANTDFRRPSTSSGVASSNSQSTTQDSSGRRPSESRKPSFSTASFAKSPKHRRSLSSKSTVSYERKGSTVHTDDHPLPANAPSELLKVAESIVQPVSEFERSGSSGSDSFTSTTPYANMLARQGTGFSQESPGSLGQTRHTSGGVASPSSESITYQHIHETSSKRISTLDYLRKAHEGRVYWFNTLLFSKPDLQRMPCFEPRKLARRATNYLLLGVSLPTIMDLNGSTPTEFLRTLNLLLSEFESFQQMHPPDGSMSVSKGRFPQMFKRAATTGGKGRRTSSAADTIPPEHADSVSLGGASTTSFPISENDLLPGEDYTHLLTPSLPFDPDFYETFATLCDVLIDCYTRVMSLISSPRECSPAVAEMFTKADARVRKIIVQGVVKEFEDTSRAGVKAEVAGVGRVILGGLM